MKGTFLLLANLFAAVHCQQNLNPEAKQCTMDNGEMGECVHYYLCDEATNRTITDGRFVLDVRAFGECDFTEACCGLPDIVDIPITPPPPVVTEKPPPPLNTCGVRNPKGVTFTITGNKNNEAQYGEFPWMVALLREESLMIGAKKLYLYQCGGSLIHPKVVLTAAHCVAALAPDTKLKVRGGEYDTQISTEEIPHQDRNVASFVVHKHYYKDALFNDIALLYLESPMELSKTVGIGCLPDETTVQMSKDCFTMGWGKDKFEKAGSYQSILKKIDLPIVAHKPCETSLRKTRLGQRFVLHKSFMCAGGIEGKDACTGDGGSPLVCPIPGKPDRYQIVGMVAWGIGCGTTTPGVYVNVPYLKNWILEEVLLEDIDIYEYSIN